MGYGRRVANWQLLKEERAASLYARYQARIFFGRAIAVTEGQQLAINQLDLSHELWNSDLHKIYCKRSHS
jgi:hypothetical protein